MVNEGKTKGTMQYGITCALRIAHNGRFFFGYLQNGYLLENEYYRNKKTSFAHKNDMYSNGQ